MYKKAGFLVVDENSEEYIMTNKIYNKQSSLQFHIHTHKAVSLRIDCFFLTKLQIGVMK